MMQTSFSSHTLIEIFRDLYLQERSGVLILDHQQGPPKKVYFDRGMILYAESADPDEDLGKRLLSEGKLSQGALAEALRSISEPKDLPQVLVNRGLISKEALRHTVGFIVERVVQSVFKWEGGRAQFNEGWLLQEIFEADILTTFEILLKGIGAMQGFEPIRHAMLSIDHRLRLRKPSPVPLERLTLSPAHGFILSRVDGTTTTRDVLSILPQGEEELACRFLFGLLAMGVLEYTPPLQEGPLRVAAMLRDHADHEALSRRQSEMIEKAYAALTEQLPHEVLGVPPGADAETVERVYAELKEQFGKDRLLPEVREKYRAELAVIESRLVESYLSLSRAPARKKTPTQVQASGQDARDSRSGNLLVRVEMDKTRTKLILEENLRRAEGYFSKAKKFSREGDYYNAIQYAKLAISYNPEDPRIYFLLAECQARNPDARWQRMAEQNYLKAAELDPWNAEYRLRLGHFYKKRGMRLRARRQFEQVLEIVPNHEDAAEALRALR